VLLRNYVFLFVQRQFVHVRVCLVFNCLFVFICFLFFFCGTPFYTFHFVTVLFFLVHDFFV